MRTRHFAYLLLLLPVFIMRDYTPSNELKYLSIVDDAIADNSWFAFYNHGEPYADKPPLFFWLMKVGKMLAGKHLIWLYGLFSLLPAIGIIAVMDRWFYRSKIVHDPLASNMILGTSLMFLGAASVIRMDMLMCLFIVLSLYTFWKLYTGEGKSRDRWLLPLWIFLAVFSKGPVGFFVPVLSILVFLIVKRDLRAVGRYLGWRQWLVIAGLSVVWFLLVYAEGGSSYLDNLVVKQTVGRGVQSFHHKEPVWYYLAHMPWMLAPWTLLYIAAFWLGLKRNLIKNDTLAFFLCIAGTTLVMLTAFSSKLQIYLLPAIPFAAYLASAWMFRMQENRWIRLGAALPAVLFLPAFPASLIAPRYVHYEIDNFLPFNIAFFILSAGAGVAVWCVGRKRTSRGVSIFGFSLLLTLAVASLGLPQINSLLGYREMAQEALRDAEREGITEYAYFRYYKMQNMDVYLGTDLSKLETAAQIDSLDCAGTPTIMFIQDVQFKRRPEVLETLSGHEPAGRLGGYSWYILGKQPGKEE